MGSVGRRPGVGHLGAPVELSRQDWVRRFRDAIVDSRLLSAFEMNESTMSAYLDILQRGRYRQVFGYPSALYLLCMHARKERETCGVSASRSLL